MRYNFDWNPAKEQQNIRKHGINFRQAATVFRDPNQLSIYDEIHSEDEDRWITIGLDSTGILRVVVHAFEQVNDSLCNIRIISARKATHSEAKQYEEES
ncbi:MAG: BrnT family toxin [Chamaesiphon sp.]